MYQDNKTTNKYWDFQRAHIRINGYIFYLTQDWSATSTGIFIIFCCNNSQHPATNRQNRNKGPGN